MTTVHTNTGKLVRLTRLGHRPSGTLFVVPLDHSLTDGPIAPAAEVPRIVRAVASNGADAIVVHKGRMRFLPVDCLADISLVLHLSGGTAHAPDTDEKVLVAQVDEAVRLGADAISVHVNLGAHTEAAQLRDLGNVAGAATRWGLPVLAMVYPRGPRITDPTAPDLVAHAANVAADLGADIVKVPYTGSVSTMTDVVRSCPIPVIAAGGPPRPEPSGVEDLAAEVMAAGAQGVAIGRGVFRSADPPATVRRVAARVHAGSLSRTRQGELVS